MEGDFSGCHLQVSLTRNQRSDGVWIETRGRYGWMILGQPSVQLRLWGPCMGQAKKRGGFNGGDSSSCLCVSLLPCLLYASCQTVLCRVPGAR